MVLMTAVGMAIIVMMKMVGRSVHMVIVIATAMMTSKSNFRGNCWNSHCDDD